MDTVCSQPRRPLIIASDAQQVMTISLLAYTFLATDLQPLQAGQTGILNERGLAKAQGLPLSSFDCRYIISSKETESPAGFCWTISGFPL